MLNAAIELILERGAKISMMAIGQRSGFSHGLVLARFGSKGALLEALAKEVQRRFAEAVNVISADATGTAKLHAIVDAYIEPPSADKKAFYILLGESLGPEPHLQGAFAHADKAFRRYIQEALEDAQQAGEITSSIEASSAAVLLVGLFRGVAMQYLVNGNFLQMESVRAAAHDVLALYLRPD